jgi:excisionase family DNA binding protein
MHSEVSTATNRHQWRGGEAIRRRRERPAPLPDALGFSVADVCRMTGLGRSSVYGLCSAGKLTFVKVGDRRVILGDSVRALLTIAAA